MHLGCIFPGLLLLHIPLSMHGMAVIFPGSWHHDKQMLFMSDRRRLVSGVYSNMAKGIIQEHKTRELKSSVVL